MFGFFRKKEAPAEPMALAGKPLHVNPNLPAAEVLARLNVKIERMTQAVQRLEAEGQGDHPEVRILKADLAAAKAQVEQIKARSAR